MPRELEHSIDRASKLREKCVTQTGALSFVPLKRSGQFLFSLFVQLDRHRLVRPLSLRSTASSGLDRAAPLS